MSLVEALKLSMPLKTSRKVAKTGQVLAVAHLDISRAHLIEKCFQGWTVRACGTPRTERDVLVELPMEDPVTGKGYVWRPKRSMYGTQEARNLWQKDHTTLLESHEYAAGRSNPALLFCDKLHGRLAGAWRRLCALGDTTAFEVAVHSDRCLPSGVFPCLSASTS